MTSIFHLELVKITGPDVISVATKTHLLGLVLARKLGSSHERVEAAAENWLLTCHGKWCMIYAIVWHDLSFRTLGE